MMGVLGKAVSEAPAGGPSSRHCQVAWLAGTGPERGAKVGEII